MNPILRIALVLITLVLIGVALLTGGCSLLFTPALFETGDFSGVELLPIWGAGMGIAALCIALAVWIIRKLRGPKLPGASTFDPPDQS